MYDSSYPVTDNASKHRLLANTLWVNGIAANISVLNIKYRYLPMLEDIQKSTKHISMLENIENLLDIFQCLKILKIYHISFQCLKIFNI